jgi:hypothetical protein
MMIMAIINYRQYNGILVNILGIGQEGTTKIRPSPIRLLILSSK